VEREISNGTQHGDFLASTSRVPRAVPGSGQVAADRPGVATYPRCRYRQGREQRPLRSCRSPFSGAYTSSAPCAVLTASSSSCWRSPHSEGLSGTHVKAAAPAECSIACHKSAGCCGSPEVFSCPAWAAPHCDASCCLCPIQSYRCMRLQNPVRGRVHAPMPGDGSRRWVHVGPVDRNNTTRGSRSRGRI